VLLILTIFYKKLTISYKTSTLCYDIILTKNQCTSICYMLNSWLVHSNFHLLHLKNFKKELTEFKTFFHKVIETRNSNIASLPILWKIIKKKEHFHLIIY